jgi:hypothetical protein
LRIVKTKSYVAVWILILGLVFFKCSILLAEIKENTPWSINFDAVSISEALSQLTKITGIKIFTKTPLEYKISPKLFTNQSIDQILKGILRNVNYAAIWHYNEKGLDSIWISIFNRDRGESPGNLSSVKSTPTINRSLPRSAGAKQLRSRRQVIGPEKVLRRGVSREPVQEASSGLTDKEGSEAEEKDEASISSPPELNDTSTTAVSDSQVESTPDSSKEKEGLQTAPQNEDEETGPSTTPEEKHGDKE